MKYKISGEDMQSMVIELSAGEKIFSEAGGMAWMSENVEMETSTRGGVEKAIGRIFSGESLFLTTFSVPQGTGTITFTMESPGKIIPMTLAQGQIIIAQKDAFMVGEDSIQLSVHLRKNLGVGLFGGEGFVLQKVQGPGTFFLEIAGEVVLYDLKEGQSLKIDPGHLAAYEPTVKYELTRMHGVKNIIFGGEGLFLAKVTGPGKVYLQTMPVSNLAAKIREYIPAKG